MRKSHSGGMGPSVLASKCLSQSTFPNANRSNQLPAGPGKHRIRVAATALPRMRLTIQRHLSRIGRSGHWVLTPLRVLRVA